MRLQGRDLGVRIQGDDVALLQAELRQLGTDVRDADNGYFGYATTRAVTRCGRRPLHGHRYAGEPRIETGIGSCVSRFGAAGKS